MMSGGFSHIYVLGYFLPKYPGYVHLHWWYHLEPESAEYSLGHIIALTNPHWISANQYVISVTSTWTSITELPKLTETVFGKYLLAGVLFGPCPICLNRRGRVHIDLYSNQPPAGDKVVLFLFFRAFMSSIFLQEVTATNKASYEHGVYENNAEKY